MKRCPLCQGTFADDANFCPMDAGALEPIAAAPAPAAVAAPVPAAPALVGGRFQLGAQLGGGRTGAVFAATDQQSGGACVVKLVNVAPADGPRVQSELGQLQTVATAQVARVLACGPHDTRMFVALENVNGQSLSALIATGVRLPIDRVRKLTHAIGEGLVAAAKVGLVHRDLSPKNVLVTPGDGVKLINFSFPVPTVGVPEYTSPELAQGKPVNQASNIYSLATVIHAMLLGAPPFNGTPDQVMQAHKTQPVASLTAAPGVPPEIARALTKALDKQPTRRQLTLGQFLAELAGQAAQPAAAPAAPATGAAHARTMFGYTALNKSEGQAAPAPQPGVAPVAPTPVAPTPVAPTPAPVAAPRAPAVAAQAPVVQKLAGPQGKATPSPKPPRKGKFRETMWFKKGELDEQAAAVAAAKVQQGSTNVSDKADEMPMEDRYGDDGSLSSSDQDRLSLRTGSTQMMQAMKAPSAVSEHMSADELARELKAGQGKKIALVVGAIIFAVAGVFVYNMLTQKEAKDTGSDAAPADSATLGSPGSNDGKTKKNE